MRKELVNEMNRYLFFDEKKYDISKNDEKACESLKRKLVKESE